MAFANPGPLIALWRPHQWLKNGFVWIGVVFAHRWDMPTLSQVGLVFAAFCSAASAVYVFNDLHDRESDRQHRAKRLRPLAAGTVGVPLALASAVVLGALAVGFGWFARGHVLTIIVAYVALNIAYTLRLKRIVIIDVFVIAAGFMLRILAGTAGIGIDPSSWLLLCSLMFTLFLGFGKRSAELRQEVSAMTPQREVLSSYSAPLLAQFQSITATCTLLSYAVYTVSAETVEIHGTANLIYTVPVIAYGLFRYIYMIQALDGAGQDTADDLLRDRPLLYSVLAWIAMTTWLLW